MESIEGSLLELCIEHNSGGGKTRIQDFTEPLLIIEYFEEYDKTDLLRKSLHQLLVISQKYKNILIVSRHEKLQNFIPDVTGFFQERNFFFGFQENAKRREFYRISFFAQRKLQYFKISVDIGDDTIRFFEPKIQSCVVRFPQWVQCVQRGPSEPCQQTLDSSAHQLHPLRLQGITKPSFWSGA